MKTIKSIAAQVSASEYPEYPEYLKNSVFSAVCELSDEEFNSLADLSLDAGGAKPNGSRAQYLYPDFADCTNLGEFDNLEAAQDLMQKIFNAARDK